jgi:hypothetical protein
MLLTNIQYVRIGIWVCAFVIMKLISHVGNTNQTTNNARTPKEAIARL